MRFLKLNYVKVYFSGPTQLHLFNLYEVPCPAIHTVILTFQLRTVPPLEALLEVLFQEEFAYLFQYELNDQKRFARTF